MADPKKNATPTGNSNSNSNTGKVQTTAKDKAGETSSGEKIAISSMRHGGHRRAGMRFTKDPQIIDAGGLSEAQIKALQDDKFIKIEAAEAADE